MNAPKPTDLAADATSDVENNDVSTRTEEQSDEICRTRDRRLIKEVAIQGFLYVSTFLLTLTPSFVLQVMYSTGVDDQNILYPLAILNAMLLPLQGFFNVFIYIRPTSLCIASSHISDRISLSYRYVDRVSHFGPGFISFVASLNGAVEAVDRFDS